MKKELNKNELSKTVGGVTTKRGHIDILLDIDELNYYCSPTVFSQVIPTVLTSSDILVADSIIKSEALRIKENIVINDATKK